MPDTSTLDLPWPPRLLEIRQFTAVRGNDIRLRKSTPLGAQTKATPDGMQKRVWVMMTYRIGACATPAAGKAMAEYYLAGTLKTEQTSGRISSGAPAREERAAEFWRDAVKEGHQAASGTFAELRPTLLPAFAARLGIANPDHPLNQAGIANLLNATRVTVAQLPGANT